MVVLLYAPEGYWRMTLEQKKSFCNGCGAGNKADFVPDSIWGLDISEACNIHDYQYATAEPTNEAKALADRAFLNNMLRLINAQGGWLRGFRRRRAYLYYWAVCCFGGPAFWAGKNKLEEEGYA